MAQQITIQDIRKTYGPVTALDSVDLEVDGGEFISLLGPSGSGKTTLLMIIAGFVQPDHGSIKFDGREIVIMPPHKRDIGLVFQSYALFPHMTVAGNIEFPLRYRDVSRDEARRKVASALDLVRLSGLEDRRIDELSGGQKQRVALARALVFDPKILLMDEPLSALDKNLRERMQIELRHLQKRLGTTTIYVTHDQHEALTMSDRVAVMNNGLIQQVGTPADIYERPANRFVAGFVGDSQFVNVTRSGDASVRLGQAELRLGRPADFHGEKGLLLLRPEKVELLTTPGSSELNALKGKTREIIYKGDSVLIAVMLATGEEVLVRRGTNESTRRLLPKAGDDVWLGIHPMDTIVIAD